MTGFNELSNLLGLIGLCVVAILILHDIRNDVRRLISGRNIVLGGVIIWYLLEAVILPDEIRQTTQGVYDFGIFCVLISVFSFVIAYEARNQKLFNGFADRLAVLDSPAWMWRMFWAGFLIGAIPFLVLGKFDLTVFLEGVFDFQKRWTSTLTRGRYGGFRDALIELQMFHSAIVPVAAMIFLRRDSRGGRRFAAGLFLVWKSLIALNSGSRTSFLLVFLPIAGGVYFLLKDHQKKLALIVGVPVFAMIVYVWSAAVVVTRNSGEFDLDAAGRAQYVGFEMFRELLYITDNMGQTVHMEFGKTYLVQLVNPIPRFIWKGKPTGDAGILLARAKGEIDRKTGEVYLTRSPGLIGEMYWNFGLFGIMALSAFGGFVVRAWDNMRLRAPDSFAVWVIYCGGLAVLLMSGRSFSMPALYGILSIYALMVLYGLRPARRKKTAAAAPPLPPQPRRRRPAATGPTLAPTGEGGAR